MFLTARGPKVTLCTFNLVKVILHNSMCEILLKNVSEKNLQKSTFYIPTLYYGVFNDNQCTCTICKNGLVQCVVHVFYIEKYKNILLLLQWDMIG